MQKENRYECLNNKERVQLSEFPLIVTLLYFGFEIQAYDQNSKNNERIGFIFNKSKNLKEAINSYWNGKLSIEPKRFWYLSRELKSRIRSLN